MSEKHEPESAQAEEPPAPSRRSCRKALSFLPRLGLMLGIVLLPG